MSILKHSPYLPMRPRTPDGYYYCLNMILITMSTFCSVIVINLYFRGDNKSRVPSWLKKIIVKIGFILFMDTSNIVEKNEKIKIIKSEIKYNRKFCKKVGFKFGSDQNLKKVDQYPNINHRMLNKNTDHSLDFASSSGEINSQFLNSPKQETNSMRNFINYSSVNEHNPNPYPFYNSNRTGSIKYCLENNKIIITQDDENDFNFTNHVDNSIPSCNAPPQLERTILKFSQTLESDVAEIRKSIRTLMSRMADIDNANKRAGEWRTVALVLDRIFFWLFLSTIIVAGMLLILPKSPSNTIEEVIKQNTPINIPKNKTKSTRP